MSDREAFLRRFHAARPGITSAALARGDSYDRLVAAVPRGARVLDLGCGDDHLVRRFPDAVGVDLAPARLPGPQAPRRVDEPASRVGESAPRVGEPVPCVDEPAPRVGEPAPRVDGPAPRVDGPAPRVDESAPRVGEPVPRVGEPATRLVQARAQALPFADASFGAAVSHLAFMLFDDLDAVVRELRRVVVPGGVFAAVLGGGPTADGDDAFHRFLAIAKPSGPALGDRRASTPDGWRALFGRPADFTRFELELSGPFAEVWRFLGASYQLADAERDRVAAALRAAFADPVPCRVVLWLATVTL